ncbi:hypothetical protein QQ045_013578 [Rhodiola kirilowii]
METELQRLIKVFSTATASLCYCYYVVSRIPKGVTRLIFILPAIILFTLLPFNLHTFHFGCTTAFILIWLGNFKLLLFAFDLGPLSNPKSLAQFITTASFPINVKQIEFKSPAPNQTLKSSLLFLTKFILLLSTIYLFQFDYKRFLHPDLVLIVYCFFMYLACENFLAVSVLPIKLFLGHQFYFDPQFNDPYLSTSLQDFWGRRWNLMVTTILRPSIYDPVRRALAAILGPRPASFAATVAAFAVSGLMHEIIWFYLTRVSPTWEVTRFFVLHGVCTAAEAAAKRAVGGRVRVPAAVSTPLTLVFLALTAKWLFFPQLLRNGVDEWAISEYAPLVEIVKKTKNWMELNVVGSIGGSHAIW